SFVNYRYIMRVKFLIMALVTVGLHLSAASFAQRVTIRQSNISLEKMLQLVSEQTGVNMIYNPNMLQEANPLTVDLANASLREALDEAFRNQPLTYSIDQDVVVVKR